MREMMNRPPAAASWHIRRYESGDAGRVQEIRAAAFAPVFASFRAIVGPSIAEPLFGEADASQARYLASLYESDERERLFVVEAEGAGVGFVHLSLDEDKCFGEIGLNAVDPAYSGRGIGTALYRFAIDYFRSHGMKAAKVATGGDSSHASARKAYEKAGFDIALPTVTYYMDLT